MLDYTKAAVKKTVDDFKRLDYIRNIVTQVLYIGYLIYALIASSGVLWANILLLTLSVAYFVFFLVITAGEKSKAKKKAKKLAKKIFKRCKQLVKLFTTIVMVYGVCVTTKAVTPFAVVLAAFMIVAWLLQIVFDLIFHLFIKKANLLIEGVKADVQAATKPVKSVGNFFKKLTGKQVEPEPEKNKERIWLDNKVAENKAERAEQKRLEKERRKNGESIEEEPFDEQSGIDEVQRVAGAHTLIDGGKCLLFGADLIFAHTGDHIVVTVGDMSKFHTLDTGIDQKFQVIFVKLRQFFHDNDIVFVGNIVNCVVF